jgi:hypothetical protein
MHYQGATEPQYLLVRYEGLGLGNCTAVRDGPTRCCTDYNGKKGEFRLAYDCYWVT